MRCLFFEKCWAKWYAGPNHVISPTYLSFTTNIHYSEWGPAVLRLGGSHGCTQYKSGCISSCTVVELRRASLASCTTVIWGLASRSPSQWQFRLLRTSRGNYYRPASRKKACSPVCLKNSSFWGQTLRSRTDSRPGYCLIPTPDDRTFVDFALIAYLYNRHRAVYYGDGVIRAEHVCVLQSMETFLIPVAFL